MKMFVKYHYFVWHQFPNERRQRLAPSYFFCFSSMEASSTFGQKVFQIKFGDKESFVRLCPNCDPLLENYPIYYFFNFEIPPI